MEATKMDKDLWQKIKDTPITLSTLILLLGGGGGSVITMNAQSANISRLEQAVERSALAIEQLKEHYAEQSLRIQQDMLRQQNDVFREIHDINKRLSKSGF